MDKAQDAILLDEHDMRTGILLAHEAARARAALETCARVEQALLEDLAQKYRVDLTQYQLTDWLRGFERRE